MNVEMVRRDFDELARLTAGRDSGFDRYESFLHSLVPATAVDVLEVGCGAGRLTARLAAAGRRVTGIDLSPEMIARARREVDASSRVTFICDDFLSCELTPLQFDCVVSAAALHHMPADMAVPRMIDVLRPGGRLIVHVRDCGRGCDRCRAARYMRAAAAWSQFAAGLYAANIPLGLSRCVQMCSAHTPSGSLRIIGRPSTCGGSAAVQRSNGIT